MEDHKRKIRHQLVFFPFFITHNVNKPRDIPLIIKLKLKKLLIKPKSLKESVNQLKFL